MLGRGRSGVVGSAGAGSRYSTYDEEDEGVADEHAAGVERRPHPGLGLVVRDGDVEVDAVALRPRRVHLLEPDRGQLARRVDQGVRLAIDDGLVGVAEDRLPE